MATSDIKKGPLYVDSTNNRVGVGTASPAAKAEIYGTAAAQNLALRVTNTAADGYSTIQFGDILAGVYRNGSAQSSYGGASSLNILTVGGHPITLGTSNTVRLTVDPSGRVTMPYQPAFHVYHTLTVPSNTYIAHNAAIVNNGGHYNSTNGKFTAPVAGNYIFYATGLTQPTGGTSRMRIVKNGSTYVSGESRHQGGTAGAYLHATIQAVVYLAASDWVQQYYINDDGSTTLYSDGTPYITFGGHLIG